MNYKLSNRGDPSISRIGLNCLDRSKSHKQWLINDRRHLWMLLAVCLVPCFPLPILQAQFQTPEKEPDQQQIKMWISKLADPRFLVRENAKARLSKAGAAAYNQLYRSKNISDLESRLIINELLSLIKIHWIRPDDSQAVIDLMLDFQLRPIPDRLAVIDRLSWLPTNESWRALNQILVYDKSPQVSDYAAARLMEMIFLRDAGAAESITSAFAEDVANRHRTLEHLLKSDSRWGEKMVSICFAIATAEDRIVSQSNLVSTALDIQQSEAKAPQDPSTALRLVESRLIANRVLYQRIIDQARSSENEVEVVLKRLDRIGISLALLANDVSTTHLLLDMFLENKRHANAETVARQFAKTIQEDPLSGVMVAECFRLGKRNQQADKLAAQSLANVPHDRIEVELFVDALQQRQLNYWASQLLKDRLTAGQLGPGARILLAEVELARGQTDEAMSIVEELLAQDPEAQLRLRCLWVLSNVAKAQNDPKKELDALTAALKLDPLSADALVRIHQVGDRVTGFDRVGFRKQVANARGAFLDQFRRGSELMNSELPAEENLGRVRVGRAAYFLARLLSHLEIDDSEALKMARTAVKLEPRNPDYLDCLAFCEFKRGNRDLAIAIQRRAVFSATDGAEFRARLDKYLNQK